MSNEAVPQQPFWLPVLTPKQLTVFNNYSRYLLLSGPRRSGKTIAALHKIVRHAFDFPKAKILIIVKTLGTAISGGIWTDLHETVLPEWINAGITDYVIPPKQDQTRTLFCSIRNRYGTETKIYLNSLEYDLDAEKKFRGRRFSLVMYSELSNFNSRIVFNAAKEMLRIPGMRHNDMQMICDTNPHPAGEKSWIWQLWWGERLMDGVPETCTTTESVEEFRQFQKELDVIEISIPENFFLSKEEKQSLIASYRSNPDELQRYIYGRWVTATTDAFFSKIFLEEVHVVGNSDSLNPDEWEGILPPPETAEIFIGYDIGDLNPALVFLTKSRDSLGKNYWSIIDEIVVEDEKIGIEDLVSAIIRKMDKWEKFLGHPILFRHWSDNSSLNHKIAASASEHIMIHRYSRGRIKIEAADKYPRAAMDAIDMIKRLLYEGRLFVSATCTHTIQMFRSLRPKFTRDGQVESVAKTQHIHVFDALRYAIMREEPRDLRKFDRPDSGKVRPRIIQMA